MELIEDILLTLLVIQMSVVFYIMWKHMVSSEKEFDKLFEPPGK